MVLIASVLLVVRHLAPAILADSLDKIVGPFAEFLFLLFGVDVHLFDFG